MVSVYFAGHSSFGNRGCEALIRANVKTLRQYLPDASFLVPSNDIGRDAAQWPQAPTLGVRFVASEPIPQMLRWWSRARRVIGAVSAYRPPLRVTPPTSSLIRASDVLVMTGGDIISLDYGLESLFFWMSVCEEAMDNGVKTVLWGASVGPFKTDPGLERRMTVFLKRFDLITVRETASLEYLRGLGITAELVMDSAFSLDPEPPRQPLALGVFAGEGALLGFNVSPVIEKFRVSDADRELLFNEVVDFLADVAQSRGDRVLLIPHVDPFGPGGDYNSDSFYMRRILQALRAKGFDEKRVDLLPAGLNAAELKQLISRCDYFMGGRTHATIAAFSMGVPTTSIAYSVKAKGINKDMFGHLDFVLETPQVSRGTLQAHYQALQHRRAEVQAHLQATLPHWRQRSSASAATVAKLLGH